MKKNILWVTSRIPYPPIGGDKLKSFHLLKILSKNYNVYLATVTYEDCDEETHRFLKSHTADYKIFQKPMCSFYFNTLKSFTNYLPLQSNFYYFDDVQEHINALIKKSQFDCLISTLIRTTRYIEDFSHKKIFDAVDSIALNYVRSKSNVSSLFWKAIYYLETPRLFAYEKNCVSKFDHSLFVNKAESDFWRKYGRTQCIPNGVDEKITIYEKKNPAYRDALVFFGKMDYQPNIDAVLWFSEHVLPYVHPRIRFLIVGANPNKRVLALEKKHKRVTVTGFIEDPYEILQNSLAVVAPMQTGGGIQNKLLEAMGCGSLAITSSISAKPITGARHGEHFLIADAPPEWISLVNDAYETPDLFLPIRQHARSFIAKNFMWQNYEEKLSEILESS